MDSHPHQQSLVLAEQSLTALSPGLRRLCEREPSTDAAVLAIASDLALMAEARAVFDGMQQLSRLPAGEAGVRAVIGNLFTIYGWPDRLDEEWPSWWLQYFSALAELPLVLLAAGAMEYVKLGSSEFVPPPGRLRELALTVRSPLHQSVTRLRLALGQVPATSGRRGREPPTPEERERVKAMAEQWVGEIAEKARLAEAAKPKPRFDPPPVDRGGLTAAMREHMKRQSGLRNDWQENGGNP